GWVLALAFAPNGRQLATAGKDGVVRVWDPESGRLVVPLKGHTSNVTQLIWEVESRWLLSSGADGKVFFWTRFGPQDADDRDPDRADRPAALAFTPDGKYVGGAGPGRVPPFDAAELRAWPVAGGEDRVFQGSVLGFLTMALSPDGKTLATGMGQALNPA